MLSDESGIDLPARPAGLDGPAAVWQAPLTLPTYHPELPERYPVYLDRRVYQGSSGRVYPLPFHHAVAAEPVPHTWRAVHLCNEWLHVVVLPELGGRVHVVRDLTSGVDLFYANPVIKPALVGLAGPWIAGGMELNWPQHHRPATYLPTDFELATEPDGAVLVRCSDHDPFTRMKAMHTVRLRPGSSVLELAVRLYNRSELTQSFLWWANVAARVDEDYQSFFPRDVEVVGDHAKRAVTAYPRADRPYYGIDYPRRAADLGQATDGARLSGDRLDWYRNIPVPTSYMALTSREDFFGGYDHASRVGFVHVADHQVAVGKKQWTWGNAPFGHAWDANLSDDGAHYIELMAGVFTDNQPDFSYLAPGETKVFSQHWYPIREVGPVDRASLDAAVVLRRDGEQLRAGVVVTRPRPGLTVRLTAAGQLLADQRVDLDPGRAHQVTVPLADGAPVTVTVEHAGRTLVTWTEPHPTPRDQAIRVEPATEPPAPAEVASVEELALTARHLELYRHATRSPEPYWREALRRDDGHVDSLLGLAGRAYRSARYEQAREYLERAAARLTRRHPTPLDTTALYLLGLTCERLGDDVAAYGAYGRASWSRAWRGPAGYRMARIDARHHRDHEALRRLADVARTEPEHLQALALQVVLQRRVGQRGQADAVLDAARELDPLDAWLRRLAGCGASEDAQTCLDVALELAGVGEHDQALALIEQARQREAHRPAGQTATGPLLDYHRAGVLTAAGRAVQAAAARDRARSTDPMWCFPSRLEDVAALSAAAAADPTDARARALLGHWLYQAGRAEEAITAWQQAAALDGTDPVVWRNLGLARVDHEHDLPAAAQAYQRAVALAPGDARLRYEQDQLAALRAVPPQQRLETWRRHWELAVGRHDALVEVAHLMVTVGEAGPAVEVLTEHTFQPWEGGEGQVLSAWERAHVRLAVEALAAGQAAVAPLRAALAPPGNLGEARHPLASTAQLRLLLGDALVAAGHPEQARVEWESAADHRGDFVQMATQEHSETTFWSVLALRRLGAWPRAAALTQALRRFRAEYAAQTPTVDYFATSLPDLLLFAEDPLAVRDRRVAVLDAQLALLDGDPDAARRRLTDPALAASRHAPDLLHALLRLGADALLGPVDAQPGTDTAKERVAR